MKSFKKFVKEKNSGVIPQPIHFRHVKKHKKKHKKVVKESVYDWVNQHDNDHLSKSKTSTSFPSVQWDEFATQKHKNIRKKLTSNVQLNEHEKKHIKNYTTDSYPINDRLITYRGDLSLDDNDAESRNVEKTVKHLDSAIKKNPATHDHYLYSGLGFDPHKYMDDTKTLFSPSFISATTNKAVAHHFARFRAADTYDKHIMQLHVKKGDPVLHLPEDNSFTRPSEFESIVQRNVKLKHIKTETIKTPNQLDFHIHHFEIAKD